MTEEEAIEIIEELFDAQSPGEAVDCFIKLKQNDINADSILSALGFQSENADVPEKSLSNEYTDDTLMPFGKFAGTRIGSLPVPYIKWLRNLGDNLRDKKLKAYLDKDKKIQLTLPPEIAEHPAFREDPDNDVPF